MNLALKFGPWLALAFMTFLYLGKRDDLAAAIEQCNTDKMASIAEAEQITREATTNALNERIAQLEGTALAAQKARDIALQARIEAENRPERVRTVIQRVKSEDSCLDQPVHPALLGCLRNDENCGETNPG